MVMPVGLDMQRDTETGTVCSTGAAAEVVLLLLVVGSMGVAATTAAHSSSSTGSGTGASTNEVRRN